MCALVMRRLYRGVSAVAAIISMGAGVGLCQGLCAFLQFGLYESFAYVFSASYVGIIVGLFLGGLCWRKLRLLSGRDLADVVGTTVVVGCVAAYLLSFLDAGWLSLFISPIALVMSLIAKSDPLETREQGVRNHFPAYYCQWPAGDPDNYCDSFDTCLDNNALWSACSYREGLCKPEDVAKLYNSLKAWFNSKKNSNSFCSFPPERQSSSR